MKPSPAFGGAFPFASKPAAPTNDSLTSSTLKVCGWTAAPDDATTSIAPAKTHTAKSRCMPAHPPGSGCSCQASGSGHDHVDPKSRPDKHPPSLATLSEAKVGLQTATIPQPANGARAFSALRQVSAAKGLTAEEPQSRRGRNAVSRVATVSRRI